MKRVKPSGTLTQRNDDEDNAAKGAGISSIVLAKVACDRITTKKRPNSTLEQDALKRTNAIIKYYGN
jgi:hypothetical protein